LNTATNITRWETAIPNY